jgi:hypothetical protein
MKPIPANATGAWCAIKYHDEDKTLSPVFFSFGEYDPDKDEVYDRSDTETTSCSTTRHQTNCLGLWLRVGTTSKSCRWTSTR